MTHNSFKHLSLSALIRLASIAALAAVMLGVAPLPVARAQENVIYVTVFTDEWINNGNCSLREAIQASNNDTNWYGCTYSGLAGPDVIVLPAGTYTLSIAGVIENSNLTGDLDIAAGNVVYITDDGVNGATIYADGIDRVLDIQIGATVTLNALTITGGSTPTDESGGGIRSSGSLTVQYCAIHDNQATGTGSGADGGGIDSAQPTGSLTVYNSSIFGNTADDDGGGIRMYGPTTLDNATIFGNTANGAVGNADGGGIYVLSASAVVTPLNTIIANNSGFAQCGVNLGTINSLGYNIASDASCNLTGTGDQPSTDPQLGSCGDQGGPTPLCPIAADNDPPHNSGSCTDSNGDPVDYDQNFKLRNDGFCDIGAEERGTLTLIDLASFGAAPSGGGVLVTWETASEIDNAGFNVYRSHSPFGDWLRLNAALIPAQGGPTQGASYAYQDATAVPGVAYYYKLEDVDVDGASTFHGPVSVDAGQPNVVRLYTLSVSRVALLPTALLLALVVGVGLVLMRRRR